VQGLKIACQPICQIDRDYPTLADTETDSDMADTDILLYDTDLSVLVLATYKLIYRSNPTIRVSKSVKSILSLQPINPNQLAVTPL
jgi:hypothetical protein